MRNTTGNDKNRQTLRRILRYIRPYWPLVILSLLLSALTVGLTLYVPILTGRGVDPERLLLEDQASNTAENFALSKPLLHEAGVDVARDTVAVVTNDFHIARSELIAARQGYGDVAGVPAPLPWAHLTVNYYLREAFAMVKTFLLD